jgi:SOS-response transcriptional repressor LexA
VPWRERLRAAVKASRRKHSAIAADAGITPVTLSRILNAADVKPAFETVVRIAHAVDESVGWLLDERSFVLSAEQREKLAEVVEFLQAALVGTPMPPQDARKVPNAMALNRRSDIPRQAQARGARLVFRAVGTSMADADVADGDLVFVRPTGDVRAAHGSLVVCRLGGSEYLKELEVRAGRIRLLSRNDRYAPIEVTDGDSDFALIGVVVGPARHRR